SHAESKKKSGRQEPPQPSQRNSKGSDRRAAQRQESTPPASLRLLKDQRSASLGGEHELPRLVGNGHPERLLGRPLVADGAENARAGPVRQFARFNLFRYVVLVSLDGRFVFLLGVRSGMIL